MVGVGARTFRSVESVLDGREDEESVLEEAVAVAVAVAVSGVTGAAEPTVAAAAAGAGTGAAGEVSDT